ncbi:protein E6-like [Cucurbita moschata]|uniref:Protein E6-like n=1 Tax=Cucurbita moschata TaxID=3662 RepID=A0A6J1EH17_CUCMO|nr:protein E6-like [Cucurbita moschata]
MAMAKLISALLLALLFFQVHARESHFFSKVPNNGGTFYTKETQIPNKAEDPLTSPQKTSGTPQDQDQDPNFLPQTQDNNYGLYGHESGQLPPNSDDNFSGDRPDDNKYRRNDAVPYKSESEEYDDNDNFQNSNTKPYENSFYYNKDLYDNGRQSFRNTRFSRNDYTTTPLYNQEKYHNDDHDDDNNNFYYNNNNNANNVVRQGMSDTRFMENGKYYYDLDREPHHYSRSRGYFRNNNNGNTYEYGNSMGRYQNQNDEAEFQEELDDFVP